MVWPAVLVSLALYPGLQRIEDLGMRLVEQLLLQANGSYNMHTCIDVHVHVYYVTPFCCKSMSNLVSRLKENLGISALLNIFCLPF